MNSLSNEEVVAILTTTADFAFLSLDQSGLIISANPAVRRIFGKQEGEVEKHTLESLLPDISLLEQCEYTPVEPRGGLQSFDNDTVLQAECSYLEALAAMREAGELHEMPITLNGQEHWVQLDTCKLLHKDKLVFTVIVNEITKRKRDEKKINDLNESLEQKVLERTATLESRTKQIKKVVTTCANQLESINHNYQQMKERQMELMEALETKVPGQIDNLNDLQIAKIKQVIRQELGESMQLYSQDQITDQKFLMAIIELNELFSSETQANRNLKPGELSGANQSDVDDLLDSFGI